MHFAVGQTQATVNVPLINLKTFADTRSFTASLTNPSIGTQIITPSATTVTITDNTVANSQTPNGLPTQSSAVQTNGPYAQYTNSYMSLVSTPQGSLAYSDMPVVTYGSGSAVFPSGYTVSNVDSLKLSIYNTANTGSYGGTPGSFDVYLLTDNTVPDSSLLYEGGTGNTGPSVIGTQASPIYVGTASFPNNQVGYNDFVFDNLPASVQSAPNGRLELGGRVGDPVRDYPVPGEPSRGRLAGQLLLRSAAGNVPGRARGVCYPAGGD